MTYWSPRAGWDDDYRDARTGARSSADGHPGFGDLWPTNRTRAPRAADAPWRSGLRPRRSSAGRRGAGRDDDFGYQETPRPGIGSRLALLMLAAIAAGAAYALSPTGMGVIKGLVEQWAPPLAWW